MSGWTKVRWAEARQVTRLMGLKERESPPPAVVPEAHYAALKASGDLQAAAGFIGHALPRLECVAWAAAQVKAFRAVTPAPAPDQAVFQAVSEWLDEPDDARRRKAFARSEALEDASPEQMLGYAVFFSGGSIVPETNEPVHPDPALCGRFASTAVIHAALDSDDSAAALETALAAAEAVAAGTPRARAPL